MILVAICARCPNRQPDCMGPCACTIDGVDIREHARRGECPKGHFDGVPLPEVGTSNACVHRGEQTGEGQCATCAGNVRVKLFACTVHGTCAIGKTPEGVRSCVGCADRRITATS